MAEPTRTDLLRTALKRDALHEAEVLTGKDYHNHEPTVGLGMMLQMGLSAERQRLLENTGDTTFSNKVDRYVRIILSLGFKQLLDIPFLGRSWDGEEFPQEHFYVYFEPQRGVLLKFDTYDSDRVNSGNFYYNWQPNQGVDYSGVTSSGGYIYRDKQLVEPVTWSGDHDCREALKFHIAELERSGKFLTPWMRTPHLWMIHHGDPRELAQLKGEARSARYGQLNQQRLAMLPTDVQTACALNHREN